MSQSQKSQTRGSFTTKGSPGVPGFAHGLVDQGDIPTVSAWMPVWL